MGMVSQNRHAYPQLNTMQSLKIRTMECNFRLSEKESFKSLPFKLQLHENMQRNYNKSLAVVIVLRQDSFLLFFQILHNVTINFIKKTLK